MTHSIANYLPTMKITQYKCKEKNSFGKHNSPLPHKEGIQHYRITQFTNKATINQK